MTAYNLIYKFTDPEVCEELYNRAVGLEPESALFITDDYIIERFVEGTCLFYIHKKDVRFKDGYIDSFRIDRVCFYMKSEEKSF